MGTYTIGGKKRDGLAVLGIDSVLDLLFHYPRRYVDRTREARIADLRPGEEGMFLGEVERISGRRVRGGRALVEARVTDCLLYTSDAADERPRVDLGGRRIIKKKN